MRSGGAQSNLEDGENESAPDLDANMEDLDEEAGGGVYMIMQGWDDEVHVCTDVFGRCGGGTKTGLGYLVRVASRIQKLRGNKRDKRLKKNWKQ